MAETPLQDMGDKDYRSIINSAAYACGAVGLVVLLTAFWVLYVFLQTDQAPKALFAGGLLFLVSLIFFLPLWLRKQKKIFIYFQVIGAFLFLGYAFASFQALSRVGSPGAQFAFLAVLASFGLWLFLVGSNSEIRASMQNRGVLGNEKENHKARTKNKT